MTTQYFCSNENRRDAVRFTKGTNGLPLLNGIDYLEVSDDQSTVEVHFIHPLPGELNGVPSAPALTEQNFIIDGGVRVIDVKIVPPLTTADNAVKLIVNTPGDYSTYILRLVANADSDLPPDGFDQQLAAIPFSFKVECPSDFDCKVGDDCPPENLPAPLIDYLA